MKVIREGEQVIKDGQEIKIIYSRRQYKVSVPLKKNRCPTAYQRLKKRNCLPFLRRLYDHNFYAPFSVELRPKPSIEDKSISTN